MNLRRLSLWVLALAAAGAALWLGMRILDQQEPKFTLAFVVSEDGFTEGTLTLSCDNLSARRWFRERMDQQGDLASWMIMRWQPTGTTQVHRLLTTATAEENRITWKPALPLPPNVKVRAIYEVERKPNALHLSAEGQSRPAEAAAQVLPLAIHPKAGTLPANLIKFYFTFSGPMSGGEVFRYVELVDDTGKAVPGAFRETELWSPDRTRFTLWLHPGRQKTGVNLNEDEGPVLRAGRSYTLRLLNGLTGADGGPLMNAQQGQKTFVAGASDHTQPDARAWKRVPTDIKAGSTAQLRMEFDEPLDWAMLHDSLWIESVDSKRVPGNVTVEDSGLAWTFAPQNPWRPGSYALLVNPALEDLAGNNLARTFEADVTRPVQPARDEKPVRLPFEVQP